MNKLSIYLFKQTLVTTLIVLGAIAGLLLVTGIADEAARRVSETYTLKDAVIYKLSTVISEVYDYSGVIVMLGTLITVASFNKHQELTIIQLTSRSTVGLTGTLLLPALILLPVIFFAGEWVGPSLKQQAERERALLRGQKSPTLQGQWYRAGNEFINVDFISGKQELIGLTRFTFNNKGELIESVSSQRAVFSEGSWDLSNSKAIILSDNQILKRSDHQKTWSTTLFTPDVIRNLALEPSFLSLVQLYQQVSFRKEAGTLTPELQRTLWSRLFFPVQYLALLFFALFFAFGSFRQKTIGDAAFKGLVVGVIGGLLIDTVSASLMIITIPSSLSVLLANIVFLLTAIALVRQKV